MRQHFQNLIKIIRSGRVHVVITPDVLENPGSSWPNVSKTCRESVAHPEDMDSKIEISKLLIERPGLRTLGLLQRADSPLIISTPKHEALEKQIVSE